MATTVFEFLSLFEKEFFSREDNMAVFSVLKVTVLDKIVEIMWKQCNVHFLPLCIGSSRSH